MRVLMMGWEFPPHITGGLGTACEGLSRGLAEEGQEVVFLVPRRFGDEPTTPNLSLHAAQELATRRAPRSPRSASPAGSSELRALAPHALTGARSADGVSPGVTANPARGEAVQDETNNPGLELLRTVALDSLLRPYDRPDTYSARYLHGWLDGAAQATGEAQGSSVGTDPLSADDESATAGGGHFRHYGADLYAEVARFARLCAEASARVDDFDVVHAHDWMTYPAGLAVRARSGRPLVVHVHSLERDRSGLGMNEQIRAIEGAGVRAADRVIAVSHYTKQSIVQEYQVPPERISVVHNGITRAERLRDYHVERPFPQGTPYVLFLGRVTFQKGPEYFVRAAARVLERLPGVKFVLAGEGDLLASMQHLVHERGLHDAFLFPGFLRGAALERFLTLAHVYVMPSVSEPFGITPLEAMAYDTPVIVSRQSGVSEVLRHVFKVDYWDVDRMAAQIVALLEHPNLAAEMVRMAGRELLSLHWQSAARKTAAVYRQLVPIDTTHATGRARIGGAGHGAGSELGAVPQLTGSGNGS